MDGMTDGDAMSPPLGPTIIAGTVLVAADAAVQRDLVPETMH